MGSLDVVGLLTREHQRLARDLELLDDEDRPIEICILFARIVRELAAHERAEQQVVLPALRSATPALELAAVDRLPEHAEINKLIAEMRTLIPDEPRFGKLASALRVDVEAHFRAEECILFPTLETYICHDQLVELADRVEALVPKPHFG